MTAFYDLPDFSENEWNAIREALGPSCDNGLRSNMLIGQQIFGAIMLDGLASKWRLPDEYGLIDALDNMSADDVVALRQSVAAWWQERGGFEAGAKKLRIRLPRQA